MSVNTLIIALAFSMLANSAYAARSATKRADQPVRVETPKERKLREEQARKETPNKVDNATNRQEASRDTQIEIRVLEALNGQASSARVLTNKEGLIALAKMHPLSKIEDVMLELVKLQVEAYGTKGIAKAEQRSVIDKTLETLDAIAGQALNNPKFRTEQVKEELDIVYSIIKRDVIDAITGKTQWKNTQLVNLSTWLGILSRGALQGLTPREATDQNSTAFTWKQVKERCKT